MNWIRHELRLIFRSKLSIIALLLLMFLSGISIWFGLQEIKRQQQTIEYLQPLHSQDVKLVKKQFEGLNAITDPGTAAYYTFYYTWDTPSKLSFTALGFRDVAPYVLRIRALGLQAQLYDGEIVNPELVISGRFDFAFVLIYLTPLFIIALMHDLVSNERHAGRLPLLMSLPRFSKTKWIQRIFLRYFLVVVALIVPFVVGAIITYSPLITSISFIIAIISYISFWFGLCILISNFSWHSVTNATALVGIWILLTLILPTLANLALIRHIPIAQGVDLVLQQRKNVHSAWETPREETMQRFFIQHPEWKDTTPLPPGFHWKWYFAFHQVGDESVDQQFHQYRQGLMNRQRWTNYLGWLIPSVGTQSEIHHLANTDLEAQLDYQDQIIAFHKQIRDFYYLYLFNDKPFTAADFERQPVYREQFKAPSQLGIHSFPFILIAFSTLAISLRTFEIKSHNSH